MSPYAIDHLFLNVELTSKESLHPWGELIWSIKKIELEDEQQQFQLSTDINIKKFKLKLELHQLHCEAYYHNLLSGSPNIYLICHRDDEEGMQPHLLTVDYDEANSYMESDETVLMAPLPQSLCLWLERFVIEHYTPEQRKKRRRKKWHGGSAGAES